MSPRFLSWLVRPGLAGWAALLGVAALSFPRLPPADTWWQLAAGRWLWESGRLGGEDPFSFVAGRGPWLNHEWLAELLFFGLYRVGGLELLYATRSLVVVLAFAWLPLRSALARGVPPAVAAVVILGCALIAEGRSFFDVRPYLFTYLGLSVTLSVTRGVLAGGAPWRLAVLPLVTLAWANAHGGYILAPAVLLVTALGCRLSPSRQGLSSPLLAAAGCCLLLAAVGNPHGVELLTFPFSLIGVSAFTVGLNEWARPIFLTDSGAWPYVALGPQAWYLVASLVALALLSGPGASRVDLLLGVSFLAGGLTAWRHLPLAALALSHLLPERVSGRVFVSSRLCRLPHWVWVVAFSLALFGFGRVLEGGPRAWSMERLCFPEGAVEFLAANPELPRDLFNPYEWGGYLAWKLGPRVRVFQDGRANTLYTESHYASALWIQYGDGWRERLERRDLGALLPRGGEPLDLLDRGGVDLVLAHRGLGDLAERLSRSGRWLEIYRDRISALFLRDTPRYRALGSRLNQIESGGALAERASLELRAGHELEALRLARRASELEPDEAGHAVLVGVLCLRQGRVAEGRAALFRALALDPGLPDARYNLALLARMEGRSGQALELLRQELRVQPGHLEARRLLLELERGGP